MIRQLFFHSSLLFVGLLFSKLFSTVIFVLLARNYDPVEFGTGVFFITLLTIVTLISDGGLLQWYQKNFSLTSAEGLFHDLLSARLLLLVASMFFSMGYFFIFQPFSLFLSIVFIITLPSEALISIVDGNYLIKKVSYLLALKQISKVSILGLAVVFFPGQFSIPSLLVLFCIGSLITLSWYFPWRALKSWSFSRIKGWKRIKEASPYALLVLTSATYSRGDAIVIEHTIGRSSLGLYSAAYRYLESLNLLPNALSQNLFHLSSQANLITKKRLSYILSIMILIGFITSLFLFFSAELLTTTLLGVEYAPSAQVVRILSLTLFLLFINAPLSTFVQSSPLLKSFLPWGIVNTGMNLALNIFLVPTYGITAAAWVMVLTEATGLIINLWFTKKQLAHIS